MKKLFAVLLVSFFISSLFAQSQRETRCGLSPLTKKFLREVKKSNQQERLLAGYAYRKHADGQVYVSALIKVSNESLADAKLKELGATIGTKAGAIWTVQVPFQKITDFTETPGISYIQLDEPVFPDLDVARVTTRVDSVHRGINLPMPYSGNNVIMGIIDFGFDYNHPTFYDTLHSKYRVKKVWELNGIGTPPAGFSYGNEITDSTLIRAQGTDNPLQMHGTSVAGIAAGSGYGSNTLNKRFRGMAYDADFVLVGVRRDTIAQQWLQGSFSDFIDGVNYIFSYATSVGRPAVVNISWGSQSGPHDGTTLFNQACNNLSGPGKIIVMSAGNEGTEKIHLSKTFTPADTTLNTFVTFSSNVYKRTWVDAWGDTGKTFCSRVTMYHNGVAGNTTGFVCIDDSIHDTILIGANGTDTCFVQFITSSADFNGKPRVTIDIYNKATTDSIGVSLVANDGTVHLWDEYYYYGFKYGYYSGFDALGQANAVTGNSVSTVSDMGSADSVLLVGAYASKVLFTDINGNSWTYAGYVAAGNLVPFSSRGPMIDGRIKPDITAPGLTLATSVSSYDTRYTPAGTNSPYVISAWHDSTLNKNFYYAEFTGTSASAPAASGIVALLLQADPTLSPQQVKDILASTAITDLSTGVLPAGGNNNWGHGKINAYGAMKQLLQVTGVYNYTGKKLDCILFPNPNNGNFTLDYSGEREDDLRIEVFNVSGSRVSFNKWHVSAGMNRYPLNLQALSQGMYVVKIASSNGSVSIRTLIK